MSVLNTLTLSELIDLHMFYFRLVKFSGVIKVL